MVQIEARETQIYEFKRNKIMFYESRYSISFDFLLMSDEIGSD